MTNFIIHDADSAPDKSRELLASTERRLGFVPNLVGIMAEAPATLKSYLALTETLGETSFTPVEQQVIALTVSYQNECTYCMAAHSAMAKMARMSEAELERLRAGEKLEDPRLETLREFTEAVVVALRSHPAARRSFRPQTRQALLRESRLPPRRKSSSALFPVTVH